MSTAGHAAPHILQARGLSKRFGGFTALNEVDFHIAPAERVGLIGPNGSGKSTLVNCITGVLRTDGGSTRLNGHELGRMPPHQRTRLGLARSFQLPRLFGSLSVADNLHIARFYGRTGPQGSLRGDQARQEAMQVLAAIGLAHRADDNVGALTQVEMRKLELGRALATRPKVLFADEALAGLSDAEVDEVLHLLLAINAEGVAIVMIEHIMRAITRFSQRLVVLVTGRKLADGDPQEVLSHPDVVSAYLGE
jgi:branched-chain amino acid transport system ATP-binding protein